MGRLNSRMESTPSTYSATMVTSVVRVVLKVRPIHSFTEADTSASRSAEESAFFLFSRMRSKMMMVLLME